MSATPPQPAGARARWLLPGLLALLVVVIVLAVVFRSRISQAFSSPTATPTATPHAIVVTATPGSGNTAPGQPTATPGGGSGVSTPLPGGTPPPTVPGLRTGMITHKQVEVQTNQAGADAGKPQYTYYLDPVQVALKDLGHYGFTSGFRIVSPAQASPSPTPFTGSDGRPQVDVIVSYQGKKYKVSLAQPAKHGPHGIWLIVTILPM